MDQNPLNGPIPEEVPLPKAPLARVIVQIRFPLILSVETPGFIAGFQEALRPEYPVLRQERPGGILLTSPQLTAGQSQSHWRFSDAKGEWRVTLTSNFVAIETTRYTSRSDLLRRLGVVVEALATHIRPDQVDRLGVRYIDRLDDRPIEDSVRLFTSEIQGLCGTPLRLSAQHVIGEALFILGDDQLLLKSGQLPPNATLDPAALEPVDRPSWILDFDMSSRKPTPFTAAQVVGDAKRFAERIYAVFRWAVTPEFLKTFGG